MSERMIVMVDKPSEEESIKFQNPIDKDDVTDNPHTLPYAHNRGSAVVKPEDMNKIKSRAMIVMEDQTKRQISQIYKQMELLAEQLKEIKQRVDVSQDIYNAEIGFEPTIGYVYYLYMKEDGQHVVSMIGPQEWGSSIPFKEYLASVRLLGDHTWEVIDHKDKEK